MNVIVEWGDEEQTIVRITFRGQWNNEELRSAGLNAVLMVRSQTHPVYVITDYTESGPPPVGVLWQARDLSGMRSGNWAGGVMVTQDSLVRGLMEIYMHVYMLTHHRRSQFIAATNEEALEIIARMKQENQVS